MKYRDSPFQTSRPGDERFPVLQGRTAIVTRAGTEIGRRIALLFAREGANVVAADRDNAAGEEAVAAIEADLGRASFFPGNLSDPEFHVSLAAFAKHRYGWLDIAVNNAWFPAPPVAIAGISIAAWEEMTTARFSGIFYAIKAQISVMQEAGGGTIVTLAARDDSPFNAATQGLVGLMRSVAAEYAGQGIRANAVIHGPPGAAQSPSKVLDEIAQAVLFLASSRSSAMTGVCLPINCRATMS